MDPFNKDNKTTENSAASIPATPTPAVASPMPTSPAGPVTAPPATTPTSSVSVAPTLGKPTTDAPATAVPTGHVEKSNKMLYLFIGLLLVILIGLIGLFFYNQMYQAKAAESKIVIPTTEQVSPTVVIPTYASQEEQDVMGVDVGSVDSQLNIIEKDVNKM